MSEQREPQEPQAEPRWIEIKQVDNEGDTPVYDDFAIDNEMTFIRVVDQKGDTGVDPPVLPPADPPPPPGHSGH